MFQSYPLHKIGTLKYLEHFCAVLFVLLVSNRKEVSHGRLALLALQGLCLCYCNPWRKLVTSHEHVLRFHHVFLDFILLSVTTSLGVEDSYFFELRKHSRSSLALFIFYFVLSANDGIVKAKSRRVNSMPYALSSVMLMSCFVSLCTGILIACRVDGMRLGLQKCFDLTSILRIAPINALFQVAFVLKFEALRQLDPDIVSMLSQANLVFLAIAARLIMQKKYSSLQWRSLVQITLSMFVYLTNRDGGRDKEISLSPSQFSGYVIVMMMCIIETVATVLAEKFLKTESGGKKKTPSFHLSKGRAESDETESARFRDDQKKTPPFWIQKVHVDAAGLGLLLVCMFLPLDFIRPLHCEQILDNPFYGWDRWTVAVLIMVVFKAWLAGLVAKQLDSVVKQIGSCLAILLTYVEVILWIDPEGSSANASTLATFGLVLISILNFARSGESKRRSRSSRDLDASERVPRDASYNSEGSIEAVLTSEQVQCEREDGANLNWTDHYKSSGGLQKRQWSGESKRRSRSSRDLDASERVSGDASYNSEGSLEAVFDLGTGSVRKGGWGKPRLD